MKAVTKYVADDGSEWGSAEQAVARDLLIQAVAEITVKLESIPPGVNFANGHGYIQQNPATVLEVRRQLMDLGAKTNPYWADKFEQSKNPDIHLSWVLRCMEGEPRPLERAISRLYCMDSEYREWGQPYYASHPLEGDQVRLNP